MKYLKLLICISIFINLNSHAKELGGNFILENFDSNKYELYKSNRVKLIFFGFTNCPDICPTTLIEISQLIKSPELNAEKIDYIFITVDPKRDTKEKLKTYLNFFDKKIIGLTGELKIIDDISNKYHVYYSYSDVKSENEYVVNHTTNLYLLSKTSKLENILPMGMPLKEKIQIIKELIND